MAKKIGKELGRHAKDVFKVGGGEELRRHATDLKESIAPPPDEPSKPAPVATPTAGISEQKSLLSRKGRKKTQLVRQPLGG